MAETEFSPLPEELSPILDSLIDAVIILDTDSRIAGWNSVAEAARWRSITPPAASITG